MEFQPKTVIEQLIDYVRKNLEKGYTLDALRVSLKDQGYSMISIERAIERVNKEIASKIPPLKEKPQISYKVIR